MDFKNLTDKISFKKKDKGYTRKDFGDTTITKEQKQKQEAEKAAEDKKLILSPKLNRRKRVGTIELLSEKALNKVTRGALDVQTSNFQIADDLFMSETLFKRVLIINELPAKVKPGYLEKIRFDVMRSLPESERHKVDIIFSQHSVPCYISFNDKKLNTRERNYRSQLMRDERSYEELYYQVNTAGLYKSREMLEDLASSISRLTRKTESFRKVQEEQIKGHSTVQTFTFLEVASEDKTLCGVVMEQLLKLLQSRDFMTKELDPEGYFKEFGMASIDIKDKMKLDVSSSMLTTDISSAMQEYTQGITRTAGGDIYVGHDIDVFYPVYISLSSNTSNQNILIIADSGSGKTVMAKTIALFGLNHMYEDKDGNKKSSYNFIISDYKGGEYKPLADQTKNSEIISFGIQDPKFIDTLKIPDGNLFNFERPEAAFELAFNSTARILATLAGIEGLSSKEVTSVENVCNDIVDYAFKFNGIDRDDPRTYHLADILDYREALWEAIQEITIRSIDMVSRHGKENLQRVKIALEPYFRASGPKNYMFSRSITIENLLKRKMVIFDLGFQTSASTATVTNREMQANMFQKNYFSTLYSIYNKQNNEFTIDIDEEVQRQIDNPLLAKEISEKITGGRSLNRCAILITNSITAILNSNRADVESIKENISSIIVGRGKRNVGQQVVDYFGLDSMRGRINLVTSNQGKYKRSFLLALKTVDSYDMAIVKVYLPRKVMESPIMVSRSVET